MSDSFVGNFGVGLNRVKFESLWMTYGRKQNVHQLTNVESNDSGVKRRKPVSGAHSEHESASKSVLYFSSAENKIN